MKTGKIKENVLKRSVLRQIHTKRDEVRSGAAVGADCAVFAIPDSSDPYGEGIVYSCMREAELERSTMTALLIGCANNLIIQGVEPFAVQIALLLPEDAQEPFLKELMQEAETVCASMKIQIAGGQSRVSKAVKCAVAVVTMYAREPEGGAYFLPDYGKVRGGQDIVVTKWIGLEGTALLARRYRDGLLERYPAYLVEEAAGFDRFLSLRPEVDAIREAALAAVSNVCALHDVSEGGILAALWEMAEAAGIGLTIDIRKLPIRQETVEVCEFCEVNPYELLGGGSLLAVCEDGEALVELLAKKDIAAVVVGKITDGKDRLIRNEDEVRYLDRPRTDEIYRCI